MNVAHHAFTEKTQATLLATRLSSSAQEQEGKLSRDPRPLTACRHVRQNLLSGAVTRTFLF